MSPTSCEDQKGRQLLTGRVIVFLLLLVTFLVDRLIPLGFNPATLYIAIVWVAFLLISSRDLWWVAGIAAILTVAGMFVAPPGVELRFAIFNRGLTIFCIGLTAWLCTRVKLARCQLVERNSYCTSVIESALDAMITMNCRGRITEWNKQASKIFGWERKEALGRELAETIIPERFRDAHRNGLQAFLASGTSRMIGERLQLTGLRKCGEEFPVELSVALVSQGSEPTFNAFLRDITQQEEDAAYRTRMGELVDSSLDAIISRRHDGTIESWNAGATRVYGYPEEEVIGKSVSFLQAENKRIEEAAIRNAMLNGERLEEFETLRRRKDGVVIQVAIMVSPIRDRTGNLLGTSSIERDVSFNHERKAELEAAKLAAERANRSRADFLANVSHELRTPMNAIIGMTQLALTEKLEGDAREFVETANRAAHSLLALLNDILDFSRLESGKFAIVEEPFFIRTLAAEITATLVSMTHARGIHMSTRIDDAVPRMLVGDGLRFRQILFNLLSNAIKFTPKGKVRLRITQLATDGNRVQLRVSVRDTGIGISLPDQERIIMPFEQGDASHSRATGGTGLGLAITVQLLGLMNSKLNLTSTPGKGSDFFFDLWLEKVTQDVATRVSLGTKERLRGLHVLIAGEQKEYESPVENLLARWEVRVGHAHSRSQASEMARGAARRSDPYRLAIVFQSDQSGVNSSPLWLEPAMSGLPMIRILYDKEGGIQDAADVLPAHVVLLMGPVSPTTLLECILGLLSDDRVQGGSLFRSLIPGAVSIRPLQVLVAEDVPANQRLVTTILTRRGHRISVVTNGKEAINFHRAQSFDVILMDVQMPGMDGYEAARAIRKLEKGGSRRIPIIAMTAHAFGEDRERCMSAGMDDYISKPFDVGRLVAMVETHGNNQLVHLKEGRAATELAESELSTGEPPQFDQAEPQPLADDARPESDFGQASMPDMTAVMRRIDGDWSLFQNLAEFFRPDCEVALKQMLEGIAKQDQEGAFRAAHSIRGLAATFDAQVCINAASDLEQAVLNADWIEAQQLHDRLASHVSCFAKALNRYVESHCLRATKAESDLQT